MEPVINYINKEYKIWEEKYQIPYEDEFNIKLLLQLRYDILHTKPELTKTKIDLIEMAQRIQSRLRLKEKQKTPNYNYTIMVIGDKLQLVVIKKLIEMISRENILDKNHVKLTNGISLYFMPKDENKIREYKFNDYIDLTNDKQFQNNVLKMILRTPI